MRKKTLVWFSCGVAVLFRTSNLSDWFWSDTKLHNIHTKKMKVKRLVLKQMRDNLYRSPDLLPLFSLSVCIWSEIFPPAPENVSSQISVSKIRGRSFILSRLQCFFMRCGILRVSPAPAAAPSPGSPLFGCGRMLSCHLSAFKALRVGGSPGRTHAPSSAPIPSLSLQPQRPRPPPSPRCSPQTPFPCSRGADFYKRKGIKKTFCRF